MTTPKQALERARTAINAIVLSTHSVSFKADLDAIDEALASLQGEDAVGRVARAICQSGKFETGQGTCALICMDQLGDVRKKGCSHCIRVHGAMARAILATGLVPDEAAIRADEREKCAKIAEGEVYKERYRTWPWWKHDADAIGNRDNESDLVKHCDAIAAAIRSGGGE